MSAINLNRKDRAKATALAVSAMITKPVRRTVDKVANAYHTNKYAALRETEWAKFNDEFMAGCPNCVDTPCTYHIYLRRYLLDGERSSALWDAAKIRAAGTTHSPIDLLSGDGVLPRDIKNMCLMACDTWPEARLQNEFNGA
jgi:hypothetical protein